MKEVQIIFELIKKKLDATTTSSTPNQCQEEDTFKYMIGHLQGKLNSILSCLNVVHDEFLDILKEIKNQQAEIAVGLREKLTVNWTNLENGQTRLFSWTSYVQQCLNELSARISDLWNLSWIEAYRKKTELFMTTQLAASIIIAVQPTPAFSKDKALDGVQVKMLLRAIKEVNVLSVTARLIPEEDHNMVTNYDEIRPTDLLESSAVGSYAYDPASPYNINVDRPRKRGKNGAMKVSETATFMHFEAAITYGSVEHKV